MSTETGARSTRKRKSMNVGDRSFTGRSRFGRQTSVVCAQTTQWNTPRDSLKQFISTKSQDEAAALLGCVFEFFLSVLCKLPPYSAEESCPRQYQQFHEYIALHGDKFRDAADFTRFLDQGHPDRTFRGHPPQALQQLLQLCEVASVQTQHCVASESSAFCHLTQSTDSAKE